MMMQLRKEEIRDAFLNQFSNDELVRLLYVIDKALGSHYLERGPKDQLRQRFPWSEVRRFLFSRFIAAESCQRDFSALIPAVPQIKMWVEEDVAKAPPESFKTLRASPPPPRIPSNLRLTHPITGIVVPVTVHAWNRFIERFEHQHTDSIQIAERLQRLFERSRPTTIAVEHRVKRMINNNLEGAHYYAVGRYIRFVISEKSGMLMTVENPKLSR